MTASGGDQSLRVRHLACFLLSHHLGDFDDDFRFGEAVHIEVLQEMGHCVASNQDRLPIGAGSIFKTPPMNPGIGGGGYDFWVPCIVHFGSSPQPFTATICGRPFLRWVQNSIVH